MREFSLVERTPAIGSEAFQVALFIVGLSLVTSCVLAVLSSSLSPMPKRRGNNDDRVFLACAYLFPPIVTACYLVTLSGGAANADGLVALMWSLPGLAAGAALFGSPIAVALSRRVRRSLPSSAIDAATLEGASAWQMRRCLLWPESRAQFPAHLAELFWRMVVGYGFILMFGFGKDAPAPLGVVSWPAGGGYAIALIAAAVLCCATLTLRNRCGTPDFGAPPHVQP